MSKFNSKIKGNNNIVIQEDNTTGTPTRTSGWTKTHVIAVIISVIVALLGFYFKYHSEINEWFSKIL